jgi:hypothetical protein
MSGYAAPAALHKTEESGGETILTKIQLRTGHTDELEELRNRIEGELTRREPAKRKPTPGRAFLLGSVLPNLS